MTENELKKMKESPKNEDVPKLVNEIERLRNKIQSIAQFADAIVCSLLREELLKSEK